MMKVMKMMDLKKTFLLSLTLVTVSTVSIRSAEHSVRERRQVSNGGLLTDNEDGFSIKSFIKQLYPDRVKSVDSLKRINNQDFVNLFSTNQINFESKKLEFPTKILDLPNNKNPTAAEEDSLSFLLETGEPQIFLFDNNFDSVPEQDRNGRQGGFGGRQQINLNEFDDKQNEIESDLPETDSSEATEATNTEFSTIKLDLSSVAFVRDKKSGERKLETDKEDILDDNDDTEVETVIDTTENVVRTTRDVKEEDYKFGEVVDVTITVDYRDDVENITEIPEIDEEVDKILSVEILRDATVTPDEETETTIADSTPIMITETSSDPSTSKLSSSTIISTTPFSKDSNSSSSSPEIEMSTELLMESSTTTTVTATTLSETEEVSKSPFQERRRKLGFNRGSVEARPMNKNRINVFSSDNESLRKSESPEETTTTEGNIKESKDLTMEKPRNNLRSNRFSTRAPTFRKFKPSEKPTTEKVAVKKTKKVEPSPAIAAAIPLLSYWIVKYISNDLELSSKCLDHEIIGKSIEEIVDSIENVDDLQEELLESTEKLTNLLVNLIGRQQKIKEDRPTPKAFEDSKDSVHGDDVVRRSREKIRNQNFNKFSSSNNACDCEHGGECMEDIEVCFCSHGFTGSKCQKRVRKALLIGGLDGLETRNDTELVAGLEVRRCFPPDYPQPIIAATGQTIDDMVVVCGGASHDVSGKLLSSNMCHTWTGSDNDWSSPFYLQTARSWSASVLVPGHDGSLDMLVIGGVDQNNVTVDTIEKINVASRQSRTMNLTMSQPLSGHCAVQVNSTHTFIAGGSASGLAGLAGQTDISNRSWYLTEDEMIPAEDMIQARSGHTCTSQVSPVGEMEVVVVGGVTMDQVRTVVDTVEIWNSVTGLWRSGPSLPYPVFGAAMLQLSGQPVLMGGRYEDKTGLHQTSGTYLYQNTWRSGALKLKVSRDQAVVVPAPPQC